MLGLALSRLWGRDVMLYVGGVSFFALLAVFPGLAILIVAKDRLRDGPAQGAAAAGLLSQIAALTTFVTPQLWIYVMGSGSGAWAGFLAIIGACWAAALMLLPLRDR